MTDDIIRLAEQCLAQARRQTPRGIIISPAAIGDCLLMLPLARFMKETLRLGGIDFIGHTDYIHYFPGRTCIDCVRSIDLIEFHRLFVNRKEFSLEDGDRLIRAFAGYEWIVSFLGTDDDNFESNLIFTVNCSHAVEITMLPLKKYHDFAGHISDYYIRRFIEQNQLECSGVSSALDDVLVLPHATDIECGRKHLQSLAIEPERKVILIHPGSGSKEKNWHIDNFCRLAEILGDSSHQIIFLLGPAELERFNADAGNKLSAAATCIWNLDLTGILQLLSCADCFIGNDSGITHLAASMGRNTIALFGPTEPAVYRPIGPCVNIVRADAAGFTAFCQSSVRQIAEIVLETIGN